MEKIYFDESTYIWKGKLNLSSEKKELLKEAEDTISASIDLKTGAYDYKSTINNTLNFGLDDTVTLKLDEVLQIGINSCKELAENDGLKYNTIHIDSWINVVLSKNPIQIQFKHKELEGVDKFHNHSEINENVGRYHPHYTFVYYIQMPDVMDGEDGVLYFKSKNDIEYWVRPEEDDLIIMSADTPHAPNNAPNASIDRFVLAGNVGFDFIKHSKSLI